MKERGHLDGEGNLEESDGSSHNEVNDTPSTLLQANLSPDNKPWYSAWDVEYNSNSTATLNMNLMHKLTVAFSMDGRYLATASGSGIVTIFDTRTGKRITLFISSDSARF